MQAIQQIRYCVLCYKAVPQSSIQIHEYNCFTKIQSRILASSSLSRAALQDKSVIPCECGDDFPFFRYAQHLRNCPLRSSDLCRFCKDFYPNCLMQQHLAVCPKKHQNQVSDRESQREQSSIRSQYKQSSIRSQYSRPSERSRFFTQNNELQQARGSFLRRPNQMIRVSEIMEPSEQGELRRPMRQMRPQSPRILRSEIMPEQQERVHSSIISSLRSRISNDAEEGQENEEQREEAPENSRSNIIQAHIRQALNGQVPISLNLLLLIFLTRQLGSVDNGLQQEQIDKIPVSKAEGREGNCTVCYCELEQGEEMYSLRCTHVFHTYCLQPWLKRNAKCPNCRQQIAQKAKEDE